MDKNFSFFFLCDGLFGQSCLNRPLKSYDLQYLKQMSMALLFASDLHQWAHMVANLRFLIRQRQADFCGALVWKPSLWIGHALLSQLAK